MLSKRTVAEIALATLCLAVWLGSSAKPAYAYADPGTGLMAAQILASTFAGFLFLIRKRAIDMLARIRKLAWWRNR
jgi:hypothetical protein